MKRTLNISSMFSSKGEFDTRLGRLVVFDINMRDYLQLTKQVGGSASKSNANDYARHLIPFVCFRKDELSEEGGKPSEPTITLEEADSLSEDELDNFSQIYIDSSDHLLRESTQVTKKSEKGENVIRQEYGKVIYPREEGERYTHWLFRLMVKREEKWASQLADTFKGITNFSSKLNDQIKSTVFVGDTLQKRLLGIHKNPIADIKLDLAPTIDWEKLERSSEENRRAPFNELAVRLDELIENSARSTEFIVEANKIHLQVADELKASGDSNEKYSKKNIALSLVVITLTACSMLLAVWMNHSGNISSLEQQEKIDSRGQGVVNALNQLSDSFSSSSSAYSQVLSQLSEIQKASTEQQSLLRSQDKRISEMVSERDALRQELSRLKGELEKFQAKSAN